MRKPIIAGNWKMNKTPEEARELVAALVPAVKDADCDVVVCVPATDFAAVNACKVLPQAAQTECDVGICVGDSRTAEVEEPGAAAVIQKEVRQTAVAVCERGFLGRAVSFEPIEQGSGGGKAICGQQRFIRLAESAQDIFTGGAQLRAGCIRQRTPERKISSLSGSSSSASSIAGTASSRLVSR